MNIKTIQKHMVYIYIYICLINHPRMDPRGPILLQAFLHHVRSHAFGDRYHATMAQAIMLALGSGAKAETRDGLHGLRVRPWHPWGNAD